LDAGNHPMVMLSNVVRVGHMYGMIVLKGYKHNSKQSMKMIQNMMVLLMCSVIIQLEHLEPRFSELFWSL
jgi:hypothetical protein